MYFAAYQGGSRYYIVNTLVTPNKAHELIFPQHGVTEHGQKSLSVTPILSGLVSFNYPHLTAFMKGRGVGDIGTVSVYDITDGSARLVELRERNDADEPGNPGDSSTWPLKDLGTLSL